MYIWIIILITLYIYVKSGDKFTFSETVFCSMTTNDHPYTFFLIIYINIVFKLLDLTYVSSQQIGEKLESTLFGTVPCCISFYFFYFLDFQRIESGIQEFFHLSRSVKKLPQLCPKSDSRLL